MPTSYELVEQWITLDTGRLNSQACLGEEAQSFWLAFGYKGADKLAVINVLYNLSGIDHYGKLLFFVGLFLEEKGKLHVRFLGRG
ncbi:hypothetical protein [Desulfotalea psychrophila]|uniref:hypothetical protein n=1 Tax=Desulfotalea psychrophila TaxID=84980 RepID=UPI0012E9CD89|nr:hypothetical protein [Desulfotalea psychrophila]